MGGLTAALAALLVGAAIGVPGRDAPPAAAVEPGTQESGTQDPVAQDPVAEGPVAEGPVAQDAVDWPAAWRALERVETLAADPAARARALDELDGLAREVLAAGDLAPGDRWRARLLAAHVGRRRGDAGEAAAPLALDPAAPAPEYGPGEAWLAAQVLAPGAARSRAMARAVREAGEAELAERVRFAWFEVFEPEVAALRLAGVLPLVEALHERSRATWSAQTLAQVLTRLGDYARADRVAAEQLERDTDPVARAALLQQRALTAFGAGQEARGRGFSGAALALGSSDAQIVLGRLELAQGHLERARRLFGAAAAGPEPGAWALRGWGLTMLPARPAAPRAGAPAAADAGAPEGR